MTDGSPTPPAGAPFQHVAIPLALLHDQDISEGAKVLWALLYQVSLTDDGNTFEMTFDELIALTGVTRPSLAKRRDELVASGWISAMVPRGLGRKQQFTVHTPDERARILAGREQ